LLRWQADEIFDKISEKLQPGFHTNLDDFCSLLDKDVNFVPFGELQHSFTTNGLLFTACIHCPHILLID
jgi:histone acetyltransferase 1